LTLLIKDGGMSSAALQTQLVGAPGSEEHIPYQNILGSVAITNSPAVSIIGPSSVALLSGTNILGSVNVGGSVTVLSLPALAAGTAILGSVNVGGSITVLSMPAVQVTQVQFGLSSVVTGQRTMAASLPVTLASDQPSITVTTSGGGSVVVLGGSVSLIGPALVTPAQFGLSSTVMGQRTMTRSVPVTLASDQPSITVTTSGGGSVVVLGGTVGLIGGDVRRVQFGLSSTVMGQTTPALSVPVVLAANQVLGSVQVSGGTIQLIAGTAILGSVNVGGSVTVLSMPNPVQQVQFGLSSATLGQKTMTLSVPVTMASDQPSITVTATLSPNAVQVVQFGLSSATLGQKAMTTSVPVMLSSDAPFIDVARRALRTLVPAYQYQDIPRVSTSVTLGSTGALGDWLELVLCMVSTAGGARVSVQDGTVGEIINLIPQTPGPGIGPYHVVFGYPSRHGAWRISTDSGVSVRASGIFT